MKYKKTEEIEGSLSELSNFFGDRNNTVENRNTSSQISYNDKYEVVATEISCPVCDWKPSQSAEWFCDNCRAKFHIFNTRGFCPKCGHENITAQCRQCKEKTMTQRWHKTSTRPR